MTAYLIRHGLTPGNLGHRYIGCRTDECLCGAGIAALTRGSYPPVSRVFASPMRRCIQTAHILYPDLDPELIPDFRECDFGAFEGLGYAELSGRPDYQAWIDSGGEMPFPGGECRADFAARCVRAYEALSPVLAREQCALIVHGGTIMAVMARFARPCGGYFDFRTECGAGFALESDGRYRPLAHRGPGAMSQQ